MSAATTPATGVSGWERFLGRSWPGMAVAAVVVGVAAGLGAVVFREAVFGVTRLLTGREDYAATPGATLSWLPGAGTWFLVVLPVLGGLVYGPLVYRYAREARGHGVPEVMLAVAENGGRIRPRVAVVKIIASALTIGSGGSVGREGPIVQIGSAIGSSLGQWMRMPTHRLRLLVACGAGGGISATFNAPVAGVFFALEIILLDFSMLSFVVVVTSSAIANMVAQLFEGSRTFLTLPPFAVGSLNQYWLYAVVGLVGGLVGLAFTRVLYGMEDFADKIYRGPEWARPALGGVLVGLLLVALPQLYGVGYPVLQNGVTGRYAIGFLLVLLVGKLVATSLTLAIGGSGGIFAPSLFMGAMFGSAVGALFVAVAPGLAGPAGAYGLVGMAAVLAGATRAPITAVIIVAEITDEWALTIPLMIAVVAATAISRLLYPETIYTMKISRRGITLRPPAERDLPTWTRRTVADAMRPAAAGDPFTLLDGAVRERGPVRWSPVVAPDRSLGAVAADLATSPVLPVLSEDGSRVAGTLAAADVVAAAPEGTPPAEPDGGECVAAVTRPGPGWTAPAPFRTLGGTGGDGTGGDPTDGDPTDGDPTDGRGTGAARGERVLLVGPVAELDALVASLSDDRPAPDGPASA